MVTDCIPCFVSPPRLHGRTVTFTAEEVRAWLARAAGDRLRVRELRLDGRLSALGELLVELPDAGPLWLPFETVWEAAIAPHPEMADLEISLGLHLPPGLPGRIRFPLSLPLQSPPSPAPPCTPEEAAARWKRFHRRARRGPRPQLSFRLLSARGPLPDRPRVRRILRRLAALPRAPWRRCDEPATLLISSRRFPPRAIAGDPILLSVDLHGALTLEIAPCEPGAVS